MAELAELAKLGCLLAFLLLCTIHFTMRTQKVLMPTDVFMLFFSMQYGVHGVYFEEMLRLSYATTSTSADIGYLFGLGLAYTGLAFGFIIAASWKSKKIAHTKVASSNLFNDRLNKLLCGERFVVFISIYIMFFLFSQGSGFPVLKEYALYIIGGSQYSYTELRRVVFADTWYSQLAALTRNTTSAMVFSLIISVATLYPRRRLFMMALAIILFVVCSAQLNKFPVVYYVILALLTVYFINVYVKGVVFGFKIYVAAFFTLLSIVLVMQLLYKFQYSSALAEGLVTADSLFNVLIYRVFFASNDGLRLWFDAFPTQFEHIGLANISFFANLFDVNYFNPTIEIPFYYLNTSSTTVQLLTTVQVGFIGSSYASFGYIGVLLVSFFVGAYVKFLDGFALRLQYPVARSMFSAVMCINMFFLTTRELHTSLLSGGVLLVPLLTIVFMKLLKISRRA